MRHRMHDAARAPGRFAKNISVATRLSLVVVVVALVSVVVTSLVGLERGSQLAGDQIQDRLSSIAAARADEVERYVEGIERVVVGQALSPRSAAALEEFSELYDELLVEGVSARDRAEVEDYYRDVVAPELSVARGRPVRASSLLPVSPAALTLQAEYVVPDERSPDGLPDWAALHDPLDQSFQELVVRTGVDDLYLIEPDHLAIVYSAAKDIDFGTSLRAGPQSGSALATLVKSIRDDPQPGVATVWDFTQYSPAGLSPRAFVAAPVYSGGDLAGYVAVRLAPDELTSVMTDDESWESSGGSGETYVVADDNLMRSDARGFIEDERAYLEAAAASSAASEEQLRSMALFDTTTLFQPVDYRQVEAALAGEATVVEATNYLGDDVLSARRAVDIDGLDWAVFAEADIAEIEAPIDDFIRELLITIAVFIVVVTFLAVRWADRLLEPLRIISGRLRALRAASAEGVGADLPDRSAREFVELSDDIDTMVATLQARSVAATHRSDERRRLLRRLLPPPIAERAEAGDQDVVEQIPSATVAVIVINGLGSLMSAGTSEAARRFLDHLVEEADDLATSRGLDRARLTGDTYVAVCGATRPHLDHASRAASFALEMRELVADLDANDLITVGAGLDSGPITVGLTGGSRLVHDTWGATVQRASEIARRARPGQVLVSAGVVGQLPASFTLAPTDDAEVTAVVGLADGNEPAG